MAEGLVGADGFAVDASLIAADTDKRRSVPSDELKPEEVKDKACRAARSISRRWTMPHSARRPLRFAVQPGGPGDGGSQGPCFLCLCRRLSDRYRPRGDCRRRGYSRHSPAEVRAARIMLERTEDRFGLKPHYLG